MDPRDDMVCLQVQVTGLDGVDFVKDFSVRFVMVESSISRKQREYEQY